MPSQAKARLLRPFVALVSATALVVLMATPADAALPFGRTVNANVVSGTITVGSSSFPLGGTGGLTNCNPAQTPSTVRANVGATGAISGFDFTFQPGTQNVPLLGITCITLVVNNEASLAGQMTQQPNGSGTVTIGNPSPVVNVEIDNPALPANCRIANVSIGTLSGTISAAGPPNSSTLATGTFNVPRSSNCGVLGGAAVNAFLGLPTTGTATLGLSVNW